MSKLTTVILAAGKGKRMKTEYPKGLHKISGIPMFEHILNLSKSINSDKIVCVIGHGKEEIKAFASDWANINNEDIAFVEQNQQLGTGHAVKCAENEFLDGNVLVLFFDTPLLSLNSIKNFIAKHESDQNYASIISANFEDPKALGRIVRDSNNNFLNITEVKNATEEILKINEINSGVGIFNSAKLKEKLNLLSNDNKQGEYLLTDVFEMILKDGLKVEAYPIENAYEVIGVNDRNDLAEADKKHQDIIKKELMLSGVTFINPDSSYIYSGVKIGEGTIIEPNTILRTDVVIGENCIIGPNTDIINSVIANNTKIRHSVIEDTKIGNYTNIGPFSYLRPGTELSDNVKVGNFVEVKNTFVGKNTKLPHLIYAGDGSIGEGTNIGCGTIFVNYDGTKKHKTTIGDRCFIGCNTNLIAPVNIGDDSFVAAGTTVTNDIPEKSFAISRVKQETKKNKKFE